MGIRLAMFVAATSATFIITDRDALAQQAPPINVHQSLRSDLAGLPNHETLLLVVDFPANGGTRWHIHPDGHEIAYILEGIWFAEADGKETRKLNAGDSLYMPPNMGHRGYNDASGPTKIMVVRIKPKDMPGTTPFVR